MVKKSEVPESKSVQLVNGKFFSVTHSGMPREYQYVEIEVKDGQVVKVKANQPDAKAIALEFARAEILNNDQEAKYEY